MFMCSMAVISTISCIVIAIVRPTLSVNAPFTQQLVRTVAIVEYIAGGIGPFSLPVTVDNYLPKMPSNINMAP